MGRESFFQLSGKLIITAKQEFIGVVIHVTDKIPRVLVQPHVNGDNFAVGRLKADVALFDRRADEARGVLILSQGEYQQIGRLPFWSEQLHNGKIEDRYKTGER